MEEIKEKIEMSDDKQKRYYQLFTDALEFHQPRFDDYTELAAYFELQQDNLTSFVDKPWVYQINTPFATDAVNMRVASLQASDYTGELEPLSPDDVDNVLKLNAAYHSIWKDMNMDSIIDDSIMTSAVLGEAYTHVLFNSSKVYGGTSRKNKGKLHSYFLDAASVHIDPKALGIKDADYICVSERITKDQVKRQYKEFAELSPSDFMDERGEIYAGTDYVTSQDDKVFTKITIYERVDDAIEKTVLVGRKIVEETKKLDVRVFPIAQLKWQKRIKSPYGTSLMQMLLPLQKVLNEIESANANANMQYSSPSYVLSEDAGIDPEELAASSGAPASVYVVQGGFDISKVIQPLIPNRGIDQGLVTTKQELERSIYKLAGVTDQFQGDMGTVGNTSGGADLAMQRAKIIEQRVLTNIEEYVEDISRIIVEYIINGFAGETIYGRGEKNNQGSYDFKAFDIPENGAELEFNFSIELNVRTQYSKEQQKSELRELFEIERQYDTGEVKVLSLLDIIKALNVPQRDELIDRYNQFAKMDAEQKAMLVTEILTTAQTIGVDAQLAQGAVMEIIMGAKQTPMVEQFMQVAQQQQAQQQQAVNQVTNAAAAQSIEREQIAQEPTGDEEYTVSE